LHRLTAFAFLVVAALSTLASPAAADPAIKVTPTQGTALSEKEDKEVRKALLGYLDALKARDFAKAGEMLERESLITATGPLVSAVAADSLSALVVRKKIFGVSTQDSLLKRTNGQLFTSLMGYLLELSPGAGQILENAEIEVLAARKMGDKVHIAYQLTLPTAGEGGMPFTQVTAQQMRKVDGKWRILFRLEGS